MSEDGKLWKFALFFSLLIQKKESYSAYWVDWWLNVSNQIGFPITEWLYDILICLCRFLETEHFIWSWTNQRTWTYYLLNGWNGSYKTFILSNFDMKINLLRILFFSFFECILCRGLSWRETEHFHTSMKETFVLWSGNCWQLRGSWKNSLRFILCNNSVITEGSIRDIEQQKRQWKKLEILIWLQEKTI